MVRARLINGSFTSSTKKLFGQAPLYLCLRRKLSGDSDLGPRRSCQPPALLPTYDIPCFLGDVLHTIHYRSAVSEDIPAICKFVDFWLSGGAKRLGIPGGGKDYFVPHGQQATYLRYKTVYLAFDGDALIGWSVKSKNKTLIHLLVDAKYRGKSIGSNLLRIIDPEFIRSKSDQSTGNPLKFYLKHGFEISESATGKHKNIDILKKQ